VKDDKGIRIEVKVHPRSSKREIIIKSGALHIYTTKKPFRGEANSDAIRLVSEYFKVPKKYISIISGLKSLNKVLSIKGNIQIESEKLNSIRGL
jgi:uncharacterized protein YggU (UPF0235/DUF167 family)